MKYTQEFLAWFESSALPTIEPKSLVSGWFQNAFHRAQRHRQLANYKAAGIKRVKVFSCGDCIEVQRLRGSYVIDEAPELPLPDCKGEVCFCSWDAITTSLCSTTSSN